MIESIITAAKPARMVEGDYYGEDGLLYCGKCRTPKQARVMVSGHEFKPAALCKCEEERIAAENAEYKRREREDEISHNRDVCFPDRKLREWTFDKDDGSEIIQRAKGYVEKFPELREQGKGILLFGGTGVGKTFAAACIANALLDKGYRVLLTNFQRIAYKISETQHDRQEYLDSLNDFDLLIIDDMESERQTEFMGEIVHSVINARYNAALPLIVTTNATAEEIKNPTDIRKERVYSRLLEMCYPIQVKGVDRRREKLKQEYERSKQ